MAISKSLDRLIRVAGVAFLLVGLLANEWVITAFVAGDGEINPAIKIWYVRLFDVYSLAIGTLLLAGPGVLRRTFSYIVLGLTLALSAEIGAALAYKVTFGRWHTQYPEEPPMFEPHPYLVGAPIPGISRTKRGATISHNSWAMRGADFSQEKGPGVFRIVTVGGSSTYNTGVSDSETWQTHLAELLGPQVEVLNLGVPGYSSAEHLIQTALQLSDLSADMVIYYVGWNDVRNTNVARLRADYSSFHGRGQYANLGIPLTVWTGPRFALPLMIVQAGQGLGWVNDFHQFRPSDDGTISADVDERALSLYVRNMRLVIALARAQEVPPIFVPQVLNYARWTRDEPTWWIPFVPAKDVRALMTVYNDALRSVARETSVPYLADVLSEDWSESDFLDEGHFSPVGQMRFARVLAAGIAPLLPRRE